MWFIGFIFNIDFSKITDFVGEWALVGWCIFLSYIFIGQIKSKKNNENNTNN